MYRKRKYFREEFYWRMTPRDTAIHLVFYYPFFSFVILC